MRKERNMLTNLLIEKIQDILVKECLLKKNKLHNPKKCENNMSYNIIEK